MRTRILVISQLLLTTTVLATSDDELIAQFRGDVRTSAPFLQDSLIKSTAGQALLDRGPNVLPAIMEALEVEEDSRVRYELSSIARSLSHFQVYFYVLDSASSRIYHARESNDLDLPLLSDNMDQKKDPDEAAANLVAWWAQRQTFFPRDRAIARLREILGTSLEEFSTYDSRELYLLSKEFYVYGIFSLPYFVDLVAEDNNPVLFLKILWMFRMGDEFRGEVLSAPVRAVQEAYPTRESKMAVLCAWWRDNEHTFTELTELHEAIDSRMRKYCEEVKVAPSESVH